MIKRREGFTLIELMIVIAIIGILAAIAIPNFISYRNKSFCSAAESDASSIAAAIADYFAIPSHTATPTASATTIALGVKLSGKGAAKNLVTIAGADPNVNITIQVQDKSGRCPSDYTAASSAWNNTNTFTKIIKLN